MGNRNNKPMRRKDFIAMLEAEGCTIEDGIAFLNGNRARLPQSNVKEITGGWVIDTKRRLGIDARQNAPVSASAPAPNG